MWGDTGFRKIASNQRDQRVRRPAPAHSAQAYQEHVGLGGFYDYANLGRQQQIV